MLAAIRATCCAPHGCWRERARQSILWTSVAVGVPLAIYAGPGAWNKLQTSSELAGWQQQCMLHRGPVMQVVYDDDPEALEKLDPACGYISDRFSSDSKPFVALPVECWSNLTEIANPADTSTRIPLFLHERSACELRRLVAVALEGRRDDADSITLKLGCYRMEPACALSPKTLVSNECRLTVPSDSRHTVVRFFSGEPDASNPARFLIRYEIDGVRGTLVGCLTPDDAVTLQHAAGPGSLH